MNSEFILEIGTEELPAKFLPEALSLISEIFPKILKENYINFEGLEFYVTPCRILIFVKNLSPLQNDILIETQGPPYNIFYQKGEISETGKKFLKSKNITLNDITIKETPKGKYIFIVKKFKGKQTSSLIPEIVNSFIKSIPLPKSMRWDDSKIEFLRPIRWIVCLYGTKTLKFKVGNITSSQYSYGHKFISPSKIEVTSINEFKKSLKNSYVMIDPEERKKTILAEVEKLLSQQMKIERDEQLLEEVSNIVEYPFVQLCEFDEKFLQIPQEIICTSIKHHQRAFPVYENKKLTNKFIVIVNNFPNETIKKGNERVLRARLNDAKFFFEEDRKKGKLETFNQKLNQILFLNDMGTLFDKVERIKNIAIRISDMLNLSEEEKIKVSRCATLCKADLMTHIVYEFPELQGIAGRIYAELDGEDRDVCIGIEEHYKPRNIEDTFPAHFTGYILAVSDRIDLIVGCFIKQLKPTGSQDPYQVRRSSLAIINIILHYKLNLQLDKLIETAFENYANQNLVPKGKCEDVKNQVIEFFKNRIKTVFIEKDIKSDEIDAVLSAQFYDIYDSFLRVYTLHKFRKNTEFKKLLIALKRMTNILKGTIINGNFDSGLIIEKAERALYEHHQKNREVFVQYLEKKEYERCYEVLSGYKSVVDKFFDEVLVMTDDAKIRNNRLLLLKMIVENFKSIIDFSKISEKI